MNLSTNLESTGIDVNVSARLPLFRSVYIIAVYCWARTAKTIQRPQATPCTAPGPRRGGERSALIQELRGPTGGGPKTNFFFFGGGE